MSHKLFGKLDNRPNSKILSIHGKVKPTRQTVFSSSATDTVPMERQVRTS